MRWLEIPAGSLPSFEGVAPQRFFVELLRRACDVDARGVKITERVTVDDASTTHAFSGTAEAGVRWSEWQCLETSSEPLVIRGEAYGIPGIGVSWHYALEKNGQAGFSLYRHTRLRTRFQDEAQRSVFVDAWRAVFDGDPDFIAEMDRGA